MVISFVITAVDYERQARVTTQLEHIFDFSVRTINSDQPSIMHNSDYIYASDDNIVTVNNVRMALMV